MTDLKLRGKYLFVDAMDNKLYPINENSIIGISGNEKDGYYLSLSYINSYLDVAISKKMEYYEGAILELETFKSVLTNVYDIQII